MLTTSSKHCILTVNCLNAAAVVIKKQTVVVINHLIQAQTQNHSSIILTNTNILVF